MVIFETKIAIIFLNLLLLHNVFSFPDETYNRSSYILRCLYNIKQHFKNVDFRIQGKAAITTLKLDMPEIESNDDAKGYYESFFPYLGPGEVKKPKQFCEMYYEIKNITIEQVENGCVYWITYFFGNDMLEIIQRAFYMYTLKDIGQLHKEHPTLSKHYTEHDKQLGVLRFYLISIRKDYGLDSTNLKDPEAFCINKYLSQNGNSSTSAGESQSHFHF